MYWFLRTMSIGDGIGAIERNAHLLLNACKDIGLAVNIEKTNYMEESSGMMAHEHITIGSNSYEKRKTSNI